MNIDIEQKMNYSAKLLFLSNFVQLILAFNFNRITDFQKPQHDHSRNIFKQSLSIIGTIAVLSFPVSSALAGETELINSLSGILETKAVLKPVKALVANRQYDRARSNIKYCLNQLQLGKKVDSVVQNAVDVVDDPDILEAIVEAGGRITNTAIQVDSTIYTMIFIPSEDGELPPSAVKYQKQTNDFFDALDTDLNTMLRAGGKLQLDQAQVKADKEMKSFPEFLFKPTTAPPSGATTY